LLLLLLVVLWTDSLFSFEWYSTSFPVDCRSTTCHEELISA